MCNFPGLEAHMADRHYKVLTNTYEIGEEEIHYPIGKSDISIVPVITGAGGVGRTLAGVALIGLALVMPGGGFAAFKAGEATFFASTVMNLGLGLTIMGVSELLFPLPKPKEFSNEEDPRISFSFSGVQNTSRAGTSIPLCYGEIVTGSVVISAGIDTHQVVAED